MPGNFIPAVTNIIVPNNAVKIATHTSAWLTSPIIGKCVICLESLDSGKITLPCGHSYHCACILEWFDKKLDCPYCKKKMKWHKD